MKKYLIIGVAVLLTITMCNIVSLYTGIYISFNMKNEINYNAYANDGHIYLKEKEQEFQIKGVELNSFYPGYDFSEYHIDKKGYLKWIEEIQNMGANTIKASNRLDTDFYEALYEYNKNNKNPIYLMQCIDIEEYETNNAKSIYGFKNELIKECLKAVDIIHGNRYIVTSGIAGRGLYNKDVSKWTIGYIISGIGKEETICYTDNTDKRVSSKGYNGKYFYTVPGEASETECIVAEIMDKITKYETNKYHEQKLVSLMIDMLKDPFKYKENVNVQLGKMAYINLKNIKTRENLKTGKVVSYNMTGTTNQFINILNEEEIEKYKNILDTVQKDTIYGGYVDFINKYYDDPVLIGSYGFSTSRIIDKDQEKALTEEEQGRKIVNSFKEFINLGSCGGIISCWQDNWAITTWNVKYASIENKEKYWLNNESIDQHFGILSFESKEQSSICLVDGKIDEWTKENLVYKQEDGTELYCKYDYENVYIMAKNINSENLYIPIDTTQISGASSYGGTRFNRKADFLIKIDGKDNSQIYVQEYYDSIRAMYESNITGTLQYSNKPSKFTNNFVSMRAILKKQIDLSADISLMTAEQRTNYRMYKIAIAGKLIHGNNNPESTNYNSLADYCFGENCVEVQIPWGLLNFSSPSEMLIHDDYYKNYGVEDTKIDKMYIGIGKSTSSNINLEKVKLRGWKNKVKVQERLKKSYNIIKEYWNKEQN